MPLKTNFSDRLKSVLIFAIILLIAYLHYADAPPLSDIHHIIFRLNYIPIILGAFWFSFKGGVATSAIVTVIHLPDLIISHKVADLNSYLEFFLYNVIGWLTGYLVLKQTKQKEKEKALERQLVKSEHLANLGRMAAGVAHEVKNPLQSLKSAAQILENALPNNNKRLELTRIVLGEINRLNALVDNFLVFARPKNPILIEADLNHLVEKTVEIVRFKRDLNLKENQINLNLAAKLPSCRFDIEQIRQALINLIFNAIEATDENREISIATRSNEKFVIVDVIDNGLGIDKADLKNLFMPFFSKKERGSGLGLSICQKILEVHGGKVEIMNNQHKKGCTASIFLPISS